MAVNFEAASSQYLVNGTTSGLPTTGYPFAVGMWAKLTAADVVTRTLWGLSDTGSASNYLIVRMTTTELIGCTAAAGGAESNNVLATACPAGGWVFIVARFISSTSRWISGLFPNGVVNHTQGVTARAPTGLDTITIGATNTSSGISSPWDGGMAEYWLSKADVQADGAQLQESLLRRLAYGGPFSVPHIAKDIIEYRSFRVNPSGDGVGEVFHGLAGRQTWSNVNGVTTGPHPPLPYWYRKPDDSTRMLVA